MNQSNGRKRVLLMLAVGAFGLILNSNISAQVQTQTYTTTGQPSTEVKVDRVTVVLVDGNDLVVKARTGIWSTSPTSRKALALLWMDSSSGFMN